jgi:Uma2 family endonuclease
MSAVSSKGPLTLDEWEALDEDDMRELVDGHLEEGEVPDLVHERTASWLLVRLSAHFEPRGGFVVGSGLKFGLNPRRGRIPDLAVFAGEPPNARGLVRRPADIMIEIVSRSPADQRRDRIAKVEDYAAFGAPQYWIVDPAIRALEVLTLEGGRYVRAAQAAGGTLPIPDHPGLQLDLDALWRELDRLLDASRR